MNLAKWLLYLFVLFLIVAGIIFYSWIFKYLISAVIFTYIFNPSVCWLERRHIPRLGGILIVYSVLCILIVWSSLRIFPVIINQAQNLFDFIKSSSQKGEISLLKVPFIQTMLSRIDYFDTQVPILKLHDSFVNLIKNVNHYVMNIPQVLVP